MKTAYRIEASYTKFWTLPKSLVCKSPLPSNPDFMPFMEGESAKRGQLMQVMELQLLQETPDFR